MSVLAGADWSLDPKLFVSTFGLIFLAELPDKTVFATLLLATRHHHLAVFLGVAAAFVVQNIVAVLFGGVISLLPADPVRIIAGLLFILFAVMAWRRSAKEEEDKGEETAKRHDKAALSFWKAAASSFFVIFIAEWGDLTQLATATFVAKTRQPLTIFASSTLALWCATGLAVLIGNRAAKVVNPQLLERIAAVAFGIVGILVLVGIHF